MDDLTAHMTRLGNAGRNGKRIEAIRRKIDEILAAAPDLTPQQAERLRTIFAEGTRAITDKTGTAA